MVVGALLLPGCSADDDPPDPDDPPLSGAQITLDVAVVVLAVRRRHQDLDVLPDDLGRLVSEQALGSGAERLHDPALVDHDHRIRHGVEDRCEVGLAGKRLAPTGRRANSIALQLLAAPGDAGSDQHEGNGVDDLKDREVGKAGTFEQAE